MMAPTCWAILVRRAYVSPWAAWAPHAVYTVPAQPLDDRPGIRQIGVKAEEINTVSERENGRLIVQLKAQTADDGPYIPA